MKYVKPFHAALSGASQVNASFYVLHDLVTFSTKRILKHKAIVCVSHSSRFGITSDLVISDASCLAIGSEKIT